MNCITALREILKSQDLNIKLLSKRMNMPYATVSQRFKRDDITITRLLEMLSKVDYKLVMVPANKRLSEKEYELD